MPLEAPITPGTVDWTGENPGILLRDIEFVLSERLFCSLKISSPYKIWGFDVDQGYVNCNT